MLPTSSAAPRYRKKATNTVAPDGNRHKSVETKEPVRRNVFFFKAVVHRQFSLRLPPSRSNHECGNGPCFANPEGETSLREFLWAFEHDSGGRGFGLVDPAMRVKRYDGGVSSKECEHTKNFVVG